MIRESGTSTITPVPAILGSRRIAVRIFSGYLALFLWFLAAGFIAPYLLTTVLDQAVKDYTVTASFVDNAYALRRAATDGENDLRGYLLYGDAGFRHQFDDARKEYRDRFHQMQIFVDKHKDSSLDGQLNLADSAFRRWYSKYANPEFAAADRALFPRNLTVAQSAAQRSAKGFDSVSPAMNRLVDASEGYRQQQLLRAQNSETWRVILNVTTPIVAIVIAIGLARVFTAGITKPIEELRLAAEEVERGDMTRLLLEEYPHDNDEIGELAHALSRMAQTIGEREAILRAQNEALAAIGRRIEAVLNATNDGIVLLDRAEGFSLVNDQFATLFGLNAEDIRDQTFADAAPLFLDRFKNKPSATQQFREWVSDWEAIADETLEIVEPSIRTLRIYTAPVRGETIPGENASQKGEIIGRIFVFRDVTRETIVDRMKTEFVSTVSHELRTPLTAIKGYVDLMISGKTGDLTPVQSEFLTMVQASTRRLTNLINDMLDISRIESGRITVRKESVEFLPVLREAVQMMHNQAEARGLRLEIDTQSRNIALSPVRGDRDRITQVIVNLLSNAIKYTPTGGQITVSVEQEKGIITTCVADTGIGIGEEDQNRLFQKFFRADNSTTREVGGTGLGLAITKAILERMHGTIRVESEPGKGSKFYFTLPINGKGELPQQRAVVQVPSLGAKPQNGAARTLLLIADENPSILHRLTGLFRNLGYVTSGAMNLVEASRRSRDLHPDAILVNIVATQMNIFGLLYQLRSRPETKHISVFLSALHYAAGEIEARSGIIIVSNSQPPKPDTLIIERDDTATSVSEKLNTQFQISQEPVDVQLSLADFDSQNPYAEDIALALQELIIRDKPIVLHIHDLEDDTGTMGPLISLAAPDLPKSSLETIAETVGNQLRSATVRS